MRALRARFIKRRLQLILVFYARFACGTKDPHHAGRTNGGPRMRPSSPTAVINGKGGCATENPADRFVPLGRDSGCLETAALARYARRPPTGVPSREKESAACTNLAA